MGSSKRFPFTFTKIFVEVMNDSSSKVFYSPTCSDRVAIHLRLRWQSAAAAAAAAALAASLGLDIEYNEPVPAGSSLLPFMFLHCFCSY